ncbi:MAG TPA: hypothetical protein VFH70_07745 [Acidimicrobiales bacterium]|nr:hypothetical protein [Acidimicrobiales bacterium]
MTANPQETPAEGTQPAAEGVSALLVVEVQRDRIAQLEHELIMLRASILQAQRRPPGDGGE